MYYTRACQHPGQSFLAPTGRPATLSCINYIQEVRAIDHDEIVSFL